MNPNTSQPHTFAISHMPFRKPKNYLSGQNVLNIYDLASLIDYLGYKNVTMGKLKKTGTIHWDSQNTGTTNENSFTALLSGSVYKDPSSDISYIGDEANFWSNTKDIGTYAIAFDIWHSGISISKSYSPKTFGYSIRCIKN